MVAMWKFYNSLTSRSSKGEEYLDKEIFYKYCLVSVRSQSSMKLTNEFRVSGRSDCTSSFRATCLPRRAREYHSKSLCLCNVSELCVLNVGDAVEKYCRASTESIDRMIFELFDLSGSNLISD